VRAHDKMRACNNGFLDLQRGEKTAQIARKGVASLRRTRTPPSPLPD
jgi:hypothetical protein